MIGIMPWLMWDLCPNFEALPAVTKDKKLVTGPRRASQRSPRNSSGRLSRDAARSCTPLAFGLSSRSSQRFGRINMRGFLSPPLEVVGKGPKLTCNRSVGQGLGSTKQSLC
jgi:hypothetical protein